MLTGALLGAISGCLKAYRNVNEVISCIMLNWISLYLVNTLLTKVKNPTSKDTYLVSLDADHVKKLQEISPVYAESVIPAGTYSNQAEDVLTVGVKATIIANEQVSEEQAYTIVKTIFEGKDAITEAHAKGAELDLDYASSCGLPYHAGAAKYFAEKGITVETK